MKNRVSLEEEIKMNFVLENSISEFENSIKEKTSYGFNPNI